MNILPTNIADVLIIEPRIFEDNRGFFYESYNEGGFTKETGVMTHFVQDNHSRSAHNVLRGLHYQIQQPQGKLVRVVVGTVFDVAVDLRKVSRPLASGLAACSVPRTSGSFGFHQGLLMFLSCFRLC